MAHFFLFHTNLSCVQAHKIRKVLMTAPLTHRASLLDVGKELRSNSCPIWHTLLKAQMILYAYMQQDNGKAMALICYSVSFVALIWFDLSPLEATVN